MQHIKPRLCRPGVVANPRDATGHRCGLRLARTTNASVFFSAAQSGTLHWCSVPRYAAHKTAPLPPWRRCKSSRCHWASLWFAPSQDDKSIGFLECCTEWNTALARGRRPVPRSMPDAARRWIQPKRTTAAPGHPGAADTGVGNTACPTMRRPMHSGSARPSASARSSARPRLLRLPGSRLKSCVPLGVPGSPANPRPRSPAPAGSTSMTPAPSSDSAAAAPGAAMKLPQADPGGAFSPGRRRPAARIRAAPAAARLACCRGCVPSAASGPGRRTPPSG